MSELETRLRLREKQIASKNAVIEADAEYIRVLENGLTLAIAALKDVGAALDRPDPRHLRIAARAARSTYQLLRAAEGRSPTPATDRRKG